MGETPYSLHPYAYGYSAPTRWMDPTGECIPEGIPIIGEAGCAPFWETGGGPAWGDAATQLWHIFENIGLPGAIIGDTINTLRGQPSKEAARIVQQDQLATVVGAVFRDSALGAGLPGRVVAGLNWGLATAQTTCTPPSDARTIGYIADTIILLVAIKGAPIPTTTGSQQFAGWDQNLLPAIVDISWVKLSRQQLAATNIGAGLTMVLVEAGDGGGSSSGGGGGQNRPFRGPAAKNFDWTHIIKHHAPWGEVAKQRKAQGVPNSVFENMTEAQIRSSVQTAWRNRQRIRTQVDPRTSITRSLYRGNDPRSGYSIEMWYNNATGIVETAYPLQ